MPGPDYPLVVDDFIQEVSGDDRAWAAAGIEHFSAVAVIDAVARAVDGPRGDAAIALAFLRDHAKHAGHLRAAYLRSALPALLRSKLDASERNIRVWSIKSLSRLRTPGAAEDLQQLLPWCECHDPFALGQVVFELHLLCGRRYRARDDVATWTRSSNHLARWNAFGYLWEQEFCYGGPPGWAVQLVRQLAQDRHPRVRADARRALEWRRTQRGRSRAGDAPFLEIQRLELWLNEYLAASNERDYDPELVDAMLAHVDAHPQTHFRGYWQPLIDVRPDAATVWSVSGPPTAES